jgi:hypothetical protein
VEKAVSSRETRGGNTFHAGEGSMNEKTKKSQPMWAFILRWPENSYINQEAQAIEPNEKGN